MRTQNSRLHGTATAIEVRRLRNYAVQHAGGPALLEGNPERAGKLVEYYDGLCRKVGLDTVLVVCQTWHETSMWRSAWFEKYRNPAGIAVNGKRSPIPLPNYQYMPNGSLKPWMRGYSYPSYAVAAMAHVHGLALWAGLDAGMLDGRYKKYMYTPPKSARATTIMQLGQAYNPRLIGWAYPGHPDNMTASQAEQAGKAYGQRIAGIANNVLA